MASRPEPTGGEGGACMIPESAREVFRAGGFTSFNQTAAERRYNTQLTKDQGGSPSKGEMEGERPSRIELRRSSSASYANGEPLNKQALLAGLAYLESELEDQHMLARLSPQPAALQSELKADRQWFSMKAKISLRNSRALTRKRISIDSALTSTNSPEHVYSGPRMSGRDLQPPWKPEEEGQQLSTLQIEAMRLLSAKKVARHLREAARERIRARELRRWPHARLTHMPTLAVPEESEMAATASAVPSAAEIHVCAAQDLLEMTKGAPEPDETDFMSLVGFLPQLRHWQDQRQALSEDAAAFESPDDQALGYVWDVIGNVSSQITSHSQRICAYIITQLDEAEDDGALRNGLNQGVQVLELLAGEIRGARHSRQTTSAKDLRSPKLLRDVLLSIHALTHSALDGSNRLQARIDCKDLTFQTAPRAFKELCSIWKSCTKILGMAHEVTQSCSGTSRTFDQYHVSLEGFSDLLQDGICIFSSTVCAASWTEHVQGITFMQHSLYDVLQGLGSMMTTLLCGVNDLEEESLLDVELERRADDVSEDFFRILHDVVSQAEALSCQLDAQGTLLTFQDFVTKAVDLVLDLFGDTINWKRCMELPEGYKLLSDVIRACFACLQIVGKGASVERVGDLSSHGPTTSSEAHVGLTAFMSVAANGRAAIAAAEDEQGGGSGRRVTWALGSQFHSAPPDLSGGTPAPLDRAPTAPPHFISPALSPMDRTATAPAAYEMQSPAASLRRAGSNNPQSFPTVTDETMELKRKLGRGSYGQVYLGKRKNEQGFVALKVIPDIKRGADFMPEPADRWQEVAREWEAHLKLRGTYVVEFEQIVWYIRTKQSNVIGAQLELDKEYLCFVMEFCGYGDMHGLLAKARAMEEEEQQQPQDPERLSRRDKEIRKFTRHSYVRLIIAQHIAAGLSRIHSAEMVHRDLRPTNIFLSEGIKEKHGHTMAAQIGDFGGSRKLRSLSHSISDVGQTLSVKYQAPEVLRRPELYGPGSDVYSYGVVLWQMVTLREPWAGLSEEYVEIQLPEGRIKLEWPAECPKFHTYDSIRALVQRCWASRPQDRPSMEEVKEELEGIYQAEVRHLKAVLIARREAKAARGRAAGGQAAGGQVEAMASVPCVSDVPDNTLMISRRHNNGAAMEAVRQALKEEGMSMSSGSPSPTGDHGPGKAKAHTPSPARSKPKAASESEPTLLTPAPRDKLSPPPKSWPKQPNNHASNPKPIAKSKSKPSFLTCCCGGSPADSPQRTAV